MAELRPLVSPLLVATSGQSVLASPAGSILSYITLAAVSVIRQQGPADSPVTQASVEVLRLQE